MNHVRETGAIFMSCNVRFCCHLHFQTDQFRVLLCHTTAHALDTACYRYCVNKIFIRKEDSSNRIKTKLHGKGKNKIKSHR